jgi:hypothetical protein
MATNTKHPRHGRASVTSFALSSGRQRRHDGGSSRLRPARCFIEPTAAAVKSAPCTTHVSRDPRPDATCGPARPRPSGPRPSATPAMGPRTGWPGRDEALGAQSDLGGLQGPALSSSLSRARLLGLALRATPPARASPRFLARPRQSHISHEPHATRDHHLVVDAKSGGSGSMPGT